MTKNNINLKNRENKTRDAIKQKNKKKLVKKTKTKNKKIKNPFLKT